MLEQNNIISIEAIVMKKRIYKLKSKTMNSSFLIRLVKKLCTIVINANKELEHMNISSMIVMNGNIKSAVTDVIILDK